MREVAVWTIYGHWTKPDGGWVLADDVYYLDKEEAERRLHQLEGYAFIMDYPLEYELVEEIIEVKDMLDGVETKLNTKEHRGDLQVRSISGRRDRKAKKGK